jgi:tRNA-uridine 2-sulfurtransferase
VVDYFIADYKRGSTPNPCIACNKNIKFGELLKIASDIGADYLATGHYARIKKDKIFKIYRPKDELKDQTYFLYNLNQPILEKIFFPLGDFLKNDIRKKALKLNIPFVQKESQDICFLKGDHNIFLKNNLKAKSGNIILLEDNQKIGRHIGLPFYTLGQRRGIEIGGTGPYYAAKFDYKKNILYVSKDKDDPIMFSREFLIENANWIYNQKLPLNCEALIRYRHKGTNCVVNFFDEKRLKVELKNMERAVTPGQSAVFYRRGELLGGGIIS